MPIIRHRKIERDDWRRLPDSADGAAEVADFAGQRIIVSLDLLLQSRGAVLNRDGETGVLLGPADDLRQLEAYLGRLTLVAIEFPKFNEGRGYSQARLLRGRYGFSGEIRAVGDVSRDRLAFMEQCGIDAFELRPGESIDAALSAFSEISLSYQPGQDPSGRAGQGAPPRRRRGPDPLAVH